AGSDEATRGQLTSVEGYVPKLWRLLEEEYGTGFQLVTEGVGGENTREALDRIDTFIRRHDPDMVLILSGIVDVNVENARFPVVRSNLAEMMRIVQLRGKVPIIGTYPKVNPGGFRVFAIENDNWHLGALGEAGLYIVPQPGAGAMTLSARFNWGFEADGVERQYLTFSIGFASDR
ncbi:MAG: hypothetical protein R3344_15520, partial [Acidobacteriota bacterium]|nr:hypothetical protein [Acidobacteriota bacterium]